MITTTLNLLKENDACESGYKKLRKHLGPDFDKDEYIPLTTGGLFGGSFGSIKAVESYVGRGEK